MKAATRKKRPVASRVQEKELHVKVQPFGPRPDQICALASTVTSHRAVQAYLAKTRYRLLRIELVEPFEETKPARPKPQKRFRAVFYDYTNNRTVFATGNIAKPRTLEVTESASQPFPSQEEFDEAVSILRGDPELGPALKADRLTPYPPMPPLVGEPLPDGRVERAIAVGVTPRKGMQGHEIAAVNMIQRKVIRFEPSERGRAPLASAAHNPICGQPIANQATAQGVPGSVWVTVTQGGSTVWKFLAVRPATSSGTNGSGIELRYVDYRRKRVLDRAHVPILNVKYDGDACGPYRDWQNQEGMIQATGSDVAPGFRLCNAPATTILDTGSDVGNYLGVAIYVQGQEVVLVSEMQEGWYRYISQWRLQNDGTILPRLGVSTVTSSYVCM